MWSAAGCRRRSQGSAGPRCHCAALQESSRPALRLPLHRMIPVPPAGQAVGSGSCPQSGRILSPARIRSAHRPHHCGRAVHCPHHRPMSCRCRSCCQPYPTDRCFSSARSAPARRRPAMRAAPHPWRPLRPGSRAAADSLRCAARQFCPASSLRRNSPRRPVCCG